jgi:isopentenyl diphosphate isomerase/L-lactate dehydrogenase-like FMN-dependent dehydrogenase
MLSPYVNKAGYLVVSIYNENGKKYKWIHRLLGEAFVEGRKEKYVVDHIDGNPLNNSLNNLQWITQRENIQKGRSVEMSKIKNSKWYNITHPCGKVEVVQNLTEYARLHNITPQHLSRVVHGLRKHCQGLVVSYAGVCK